MSYIDGMVCAVPEANREAYLDYSRKVSALFAKHGATRCVECWGDDVPEGKLTSFPMAVKREEGEVVVFSWVEWPSRAARDEGWTTLMADPAMMENNMPFDGNRMIYGGFSVVQDT